MRQRRGWAPGARPRWPDALRRRCRAVRSAAARARMRAALWDVAEAAGFGVALWGIFSIDPILGKLAVGAVLIMVGNHQRRKLRRRGGTQ